MAYIKFRRIDLLSGQTVSAWFITNASIVDEDTRYTFYDSTGNIVSEYIGTKPVITSTELTKAEVEAVLTGTITSHTHTNASQSTSGLMSASDKTKLDGITSGATANTGTVTSVDISAGTGISVTGSPITSSGSITVTNTAPNANHTGDVTGATALTISNNVVTNAKLADMGNNTIKGRVKTGTGDPEDLTPAQVRGIINVEDGANKYIHPSYTSKTSGLYKITVDGTGHVNAATAVIKSDITALGIPGQDTTYGVATTSTNGLMSSIDKTRLDNVYQAGTSLSLGTVTATTQQVSLNKANSGTASTITLPQATISLAGLMSSADKTKLDGIATGATANAGTITGITGTGSTSGLTLSGSGTSGAVTLTLGGTVAVAPSNFSTQVKNTVLSGPTTGSNAIPTFRVLVSDDIPPLAISKITTLQTTLDGKQPNLSIPQYAVPYRTTSGTGTPNTSLVVSTSNTVSTIVQRGSGGQIYGTTFSGTNFYGNNGVFNNGVTFGGNDDVTMVHDEDTDSVRFIWN